MIPFASQRGGGQDLATHLLNAYDNEIAEVDQIRGAIAGDLHAAFKEWQVQAETLTRCRKYLYSLSVNPDPAQPLTRAQYMDYVRRAEDALGLANQPRAIVFHTKYGREHCHVVWSRIDAEQQKAVHLAFDRDKLMQVTRDFARDHRITLPKGYDKSSQVGQVSLYEQAQLRQTGMSKADHMRQVTEAWQQSDDAAAFVQALAERGYMLATGKRPYVVVDLYGNTNALAKLIDDKAVRTADIRAFLEEEFPPGSLPSVEEAEKLVAAHRQLMEGPLQEDLYESQLADLRQQQQERRASHENARSGLAARHLQERSALRDRHRVQSEDLRRAFRETSLRIEIARAANRPTGLAAFLGRVTGIAYIRRALQRREDGLRLTAYRQERAALRSAHEKESSALELRQAVQEKEQARRQAALRRVDRRELAAFLRDQRTEQRVRDRGGDARLPSLPQVHREQTPDPYRDPALADVFAKAQEERDRSVPDLTAVFHAAAGGEQDRGEDDDRWSSAEHHPIDPGERGHGKER